MITGSPGPAAAGPGALLGGNSINSPLRSPMVPSMPSVTSPRSNMITGSPGPAAAGPGALLGGNSINSPLRSPMVPSMPSVTSPRSNMITGSPGPAAAGPGAGQNITITVNATERNMAQKIANEVRAVLYHNQVG